MLDINGNQCKKKWHVELGEPGKIPFVTWQVYAENEEDARKSAYKERAISYWRPRYKANPHDAEDILTKTGVVFLGEFVDGKFIFSEEAKKPVKDVLRYLK